jgi:hypothetical protein
MLPVPTPPHSRYIFSGTIGPTAAPLDDWSFSLKAVPQTVAGQVVADGLRAAYSAHIRPLMPAWVTLTRCRVSAHDGQGLTIKQANGAYAQTDNTVGAAGLGAGGPIYPLQTALVVSLNTARSGPTGKGRFFLPWTTHTLGTDHRLTDTNTNTIVAACKAFLNDLNALGAAVSVFSSKGYSSPVTAVRVGRAPDTLRSRRSEMAEGYVLAQL